MVHARIVLVPQCPKCCSLIWPIFIEAMLISLIHLQHSYYGQRGAASHVVMTTDTVLPSDTKQQQLTALYLGAERKKELVASY